jgi:hypothetical protein
VRGALAADPGLADGVLCASGRFTNEAVADALGRGAVSPFDALPPSSARSA